MLKVIQLFIGQSWEFILNIIQWISIHISVGWLAFGLTLLTFLRNSHKKLRTCLDTLTFDLILVRLDHKQEFLIHEKLCTPL